MRTHFVGPLHRAAVPIVCMASVAAGCSSGPPRSPGAPGGEARGGEPRIVGAAAAAPATRIALRQLASGFVSPVTLVVAPDGSGRRYIVDQPGVIRVLQPDDTLAPEPFLDIRDRVVELMPDFDERGLLGLAFHPEFQQNGRFYLHYTAPLRPGGPPGWNNTVRISELRIAKGNPLRADPGSERVLLEIDQPQFNHQGGTVVFGPDGHLYITLGDGGGGGDIGLGHTPGIGNGQDRTNLLGAVLRVAVDGKGGISIPADNPFAEGGGAPEIYAYGFRNPYRISFDAGGTRQLFAADVGQDLWEEVHIVQRGGNHGWNILEGRQCFNPEDFRRPLPTCPDRGPSGEPLLLPEIEIPHSNQPGGLGTAVIGGYVYRGSAVPALAGRYVFGMWSQDHSPSGVLLSARVGAPGERWTIDRVETGGPGETLGQYVLGFGQDASGEIYVLTSGSHGPTGETGRVYRIVAPGG